jgi:hypothetical protein
MLLRRKLRTLCRMSSADRYLICEAILALAIARLIVLIVPMRLMVPWLTRAPRRPCGDRALSSRIGRAVATAARNVPWNAVCLPQALAARAMLARRGCGSSFHLGAGFNEQGELIAHAWLMAGETIVVGAKGIAGVAPLARFGE